MLLAAIDDPPRTPDPHAAAAQQIAELPADLRARRAQLGLTQAVAAAYIGIGKDTLTRVESGTSNPTQSTILACLNWLATPAA